SGVGKSRLLEGIGRRLCVLGKRVRYTTSGDLITQLTASLADGTLPRQISYWTKFDLLIVDEKGSALDPVRATARMRTTAPAGR
ncbi:MAG TPA: ATP-binding protein, partial [Planctomycetaceae bacterium]|nr:ATP-binding protein [Planctomycetaceae bacterium]